MSATGRGKRLGGPEDFYATPKWCVDRLLDEWDPPGGTWVEPGAGSGSIIRAVNGRRHDVHWNAFEVRPEETETLTATGASVFIGGNLSPTDTRQLQLRPREVPAPKREARDVQAAPQPREV